MRMQCRTVPRAAIRADRRQKLDGLVPAERPSEITSAVIAVADRETSTNKFKPQANAIIDAGDGGVNRAYRGMQIG